MSCLTRGKDLDMSSAGINRKHIHGFAFMLGPSFMVFVRAGRLCVVPGKLSEAVGGIDCPLSRFTLALLIEIILQCIM
jgi:hypothetical protein